MPTSSTSPKPLAPPQAPDTLGSFTVRDFCAWAGIGRTKAYEELKSGALRKLKCGRRTLIPIADAMRWRDALPRG